MRRLVVVDRVFTASRLCSSPRSPAPVHTYQENGMNIRLLGATALVAALATAGCATTSPGYNSGGYNNGYGNTAPAYGNTACANCGTVLRIETVARGQNVPNATGAVLGGIVGAVAGHEISDKTGGSKGNQNIATAAGAVGGAVAGNAIQNRVQQGSTYRVTVRMDNGTQTAVNQADLGGIREGSYVQINGGRASLR
jgi:outer membrane lipoprotein SlyB